MERARNFFAGSLVDGLLRDLAAEQHAAPELIDWLSHAFSCGTADSHVAPSAMYAFESRLGSASGLVVELPRDG